MTRRLEFPAPRREWYRGISHPWSEMGVQTALNGGAFFVKGRHEFSTPAAETLALGSRPRSTTPNMKGWLRGLTPEQIELLKELLLKEAQ